MRRIIRQPISDYTKEQLMAKQLKIDSGEKQTAWWVLSDSQRYEIQTTLLASQAHLCCYCECRIDSKNLHVEHFVERHDNAARVYDYSNLFLSCQGDKSTDLPMGGSEEEYEKARRERVKNTTCGHKKSRSYHRKHEIKYDLLLDPAKPATEKLISYLHGIILPAPRCTPKEKEQVLYTIKRLALDSHKLNQRRDNRIKEIQKQIRDEGMTPEEAGQYVRFLLDKNKAFATAYYSTVRDNFDHLQ